MKPSSSTYNLCLLAVSFLWTPFYKANAQQNQTAIPRVELMPNKPTPFNIRDWKTVSIRYNDFIYDLQKTGQHLPFIYLRPSGINYPETPGFGLHTYVGTFSPLGNEAINVLPSLVGATLVGIDKTDDMGRNWIEMSRDFFNRNNGENIYLNNLSGRSGNDWWYDLMPNVFFYQLYDLYSGQGAEVEHQFKSVADQFARSVRALEGSDTPWTKGNFNYRAFDFLNMAPNASGVRQPEAAGAYAWVLYHAWKKTGESEYLKSAEWSLEFLNEWPSNPSYELQLPYGTYTAARMNAELGTDYDINKFLNWSFDRGHIRGWGTIVGRWGGFDVSGLVGEANDNGNDYAFQMNGVQQAAALIPMVRYDKRYARAIGKWVLNLANATRLFFPGFLPSFLQDASEWSDAHDPDRVIGYEALRERWQGNSPFSTGDALIGNWAATNLALYGTSSIGYLGGLLNPTNVPSIFQIDMLKTDFFRDDAYPTWLYYNPENTAQQIVLSIGMEPVDLYNPLTESFVAEGVTGDIQITIPADEAIIIVEVPAGATISYELNKTLANGVVIDFQQTSLPFNYPPRIQALATERKEIEFEDIIRLHFSVFDKDSDVFEIEWNTSGGQIIEEDGLWFWNAPAMEGLFDIQLKVTDETGLSDSTTLILQAVARVNQPPVIDSLIASQNFINPGGSITLTCVAFDPNGDPITYTWSAGSGAFTGEGAEVTWTANGSESIGTISVVVTDTEGASDRAEISVLVKDFDSVPGGKILAHYPMDGNALDISGNELHGMPSGAFLVADRNGNPNSAYRFNGSNHHIFVAHNDILNVENAISVSCWFNALNLPDRESFLISHGSWQNRWKISFTPEKLLRWTVNFSNGQIRDLDTPAPVATNTYYHVVATFDGNLLAVYVNGELVSFLNAPGLIRKTTIPMTMAQMLPGNNEFNFAGVMDEVVLFDYALRPDQVRNLYEGILLNTESDLLQTQQNMFVFPNPFTKVISVNFQQILRENAILSLVDLQGRTIFQQTIHSGQKNYALDIPQIKTGIYLLTIKSDTFFMQQKMIRN